MSNNIHYWNYPTEVFCGTGALSCLAERCALLGMKRPLVVTDANLVPLEPFALLRAALDEGGVSYGFFSGIDSNPTFENVHAGAEAFRDGGYDSLIALGGGSAMDAAKGIALATHDLDGLDRFEWSRIVNDYPSLSDFPALGLPRLIALPTTAGTGSELGREAVLTDTRRQIKCVISHPELLAAAVILDSRLTRGLPPALTAATGMDALTHHLEAFCSPLYHPMSSGIAVEGIRLIHENLRAAVADGDNLVAREGMLVASAMAAVAFQKGLGAVHALAHPLGAKYHKHHGLLNAILLPYVLAANRPAIEDQIIRLARYLELSEPSFTSFMRWILELREQLGIPHTLGEIGLDLRDVDWVGEQALADISSSDTNARPLTVDEYKEIYRNAVQGIV